MEAGPFTNDGANTTYTDNLMYNIEGALRFGWNLDKPALLGGRSELHDKPCITPPPRRPRHMQSENSDAIIFGPLFWSIADGFPLSAKISRRKGPF